MAANFPARVTTTPYYQLPGTIVQKSQRSGAWNLLADKRPDIQLDIAANSVIVNKLTLDTDMGNAQGTFNDLPSVNITGSFASSPTYYQRVKYIVNRAESIAASTYNVNAKDALGLAARQAHFQFARNALLFGVAPQSGEGIVEAINTYQTNFPADDNGKTNLREMAPGFVAQTMNNIIMDVSVRTNQLLGNPIRITVLAPQRVIAYFAATINPLVNYQNTGGGSASIAGTISQSLKAGGIESVDWSADDTLIGKGANNSDMMLVVTSEINVPDNGFGPNTNEFGDNVEPQYRGTTLQLWDRAAPTEYIVPISGMDYDVVTELKLTPGWVIRPEAVTKVSVPVG